MLITLDDKNSRTPTPILKNSQHPIPICGISGIIHPRPEIKLHLFWHALEGIYWGNPSSGEICTLARLQDAIARSAGEYLPNGVMCSLSPGEVVILAEGEYWITRELEIEPYQS